MVIHSIFLCYNLFGDIMRILCYGDSNTWGYISGTDHQRYIEDRWPRILQKNLGEKFEIIEEGLNSRTLTSDDKRPGKEGKNGYVYLLPCLDTHDPIDLVVLMLGTNELKHEYNKTPEEIGKMLEEYFVKKILTRKSQFQNTYPKLLIITPPVVRENNEYYGDDDKYKGAEPKSIKLNSIYEEIAKRNDCYFLSNEGLTTGPDGIHLTKESHKLLGEKLTKKIKEIYNID